MKKVTKRKPMRAGAAQDKAPRKKIVVKKAAGADQEMLKSIRDKFHKSSDIMEKALKKMRKEIKKLGYRIEHMAD